MLYDDSTTDGARGRVFRGFATRQDASIPVLSPQLEMSAVRGRRLL
jgi:hypothetical protein